MESFVDYTVAKWASVCHPKKKSYSIKVGTFIYYGHLLFKVQTIRHYCTLVIHTYLQFVFILDMLSVWYLLYQTMRAFSDDVLIKLT